MHVCILLPGSPCSHYKTILDYRVCAGTRIRLAHPQAFSRPPLLLCGALLQVCFSSDSGREAVVCALGSCPPALQQLVSLLRLRGRVLAAAAGVEDEAANELVSDSSQVLHCLPAYRLG